MRFVGWLRRPAEQCRRLRNEAPSFLAFLLSTDRQPSRSTKGSHDEGGAPAGLEGTDVPPDPCPPHESRAKATDDTLDPASGCRAGCREKSVVAEGLDCCRRTGLRPQLPSRSAVEVCVAFASAGALDFLGHTWPEGIVTLRGGRRRRVWP